MDGRASVHRSPWQLPLAKRRPARASSASPQESQWQTGTQDKKISACDTSRRPARGGRRGEPPASLLIAAGFDQSLTGVVDQASTDGCCSPALIYPPFISVA